MRSSINKNDPGYKNFACWEIFLNGEPVRFCITADEEAGFVLAYVVDENGQFQITEDRTQAVKEKRYGRVEILRRDQL